MTSKEGFSEAEKPTWRKGWETLGPTLERSLETIRRSRELRQTTNPGAEYSQLVSNAELADGVWYRGYPGGRSHEFVLVLTDPPTTETLSKIYQSEIALQKKLPLVPLDFQLEFSPLSDEKKADLAKRGYEYVIAPEETALPNPL